MGRVSRGFTSSLCLLSLSACFVSLFVSLRAIFFVCLFYLSVCLVSLSLIFRFIITLLIYLYIFIFIRLFIHLSIADISIDQTIFLPISLVFGKNLTLHLMPYLLCTASIYILIFHLFMYYNRFFTQICMNSKLIMKIRH